MNLNEILTEWKNDCNVDKTELGDEATKTIQLHGKYLELYKIEKLKLINLKTKVLPKLKLAKKEFYTLGPHEDTPKDWELPAQGRIIKSEVDDYLDADTDLIQVNLKIAVQQEIVDTLQEIVKEVQNRRWAIRAAIDFLNWTSGG